MNNTVVLYFNSMKMVILSENKLKNNSLTMNENHELTKSKRLFIFMV